MKVLAAILVAVVLAAILAVEIAGEGAVKVSPVILPPPPAQAHLHPGQHRRNFCDPPNPPHTFCHRRR